ncbi:MAG: conjugal transfer protein TraG N-terminal domain-containing protein [Deferribacterales bacterium]
MEFDFYVYGDFTSIVNAFKMVAGIFSSSSYKSWITVLMIFASAGFAFHMNMERAFGAKLNDSVWIKRLFWGMALYSIFMVPTVTMHIYDPVKNRYEAVGGVPLGAGMIASVTSSASRELTDIIETAGSPIMSANDIGFGDGFELLAASSAMGQIGNMNDHFLARSVYDYIEKCFRQAYANGDITDKDIWTSDNLLESFRLNYRVFSSVIYDDANPGGVLYECADAYTNISARLMNPTFTENVMYKFCSNSGFNVSNVSEYQACKDKFSGLVDSFATDTGLSVTLSNYVASAFIARQYLMGGVNAGTQNAIEIAKSMAVAANTVAGGVADEYIPKLQGMIITILISTFIIVALFVYMAPVDAFKWYIGMWIWVIMWFVVDAIINVNVQTHAYEVFRDIRSTGVGLNSMFYTGSDTLKVLAMYSNARWISMSLASVISFGIIKMGGSAAFASMTSALGQQYRSSASGVGSQLGTPGGQADFHSKNFDRAADIPSMTGLKTPDNLSVAQFNRSTDIGKHFESGGRIMDKFGGETAPASAAMGAGEYTSTMEKIGHGAGALSAESETGVSIEQANSAATQKRHGEMAGTSDLLGKNKVTVDDYREIAKTGALESKGRSEAAREMADTLGIGYDTISKDINTKSGLEKHAAYSNIKKLAENSGMNMNEFFDKSTRSAKLSLNDSEADKLGLSGAGQYSVSWDDSGKFTYTDMRSGGYSQQTFESIDVLDSEGNDRTLVAATTETKGDKLSISGTDQNGSLVNISGVGIIRRDDQGEQYAEFSAISNQSEERTNTSKMTFEDIEVQDTDGNITTLSGVTAEGKDNNLTINGTDKSGSLINIKGIGGIQQDENGRMRAVFDTVAIRSSEKADTSRMAFDEMNILLPDGSHKSLSGVSSESINGGVIIKGTDQEGNKVTLEGIGDISTGKNGTGLAELSKVSVDKTENIDKSVTDHLSTVQEGFKKEDIDKNVYDRSRKYDGAFTALLDKDSATEMAGQITGSGEYAKEADAQARAIAKDMSEIYKSKGVIAGTTYVGTGGSMNAQASLGLSFLGSGLKGSVSADTSVGIERKNTEKEEYDLNISLIKGMQKQARTIATNETGKLDEKLYNETLGSMYNDMAAKLNNVSENTGKLQFGASAVFGEAWHTLSTDQVQDILKNPSKIVPDNNVLAGNESNTVIQQTDGQKSTFDARSESTTEGSTAGLPPIASKGYETDINVPRQAQNELDTDSKDMTSRNDTEHQPMHRIPTDENKPQHTDEPKKILKNADDPISNYQNIQNNSKDILNNSEFNIPINDLRDEFPKETPNDKRRRK